MKCGATPIIRPRARSIPTFCACGKNWKKTPPIQYISVLSTERATSLSGNRSGEEMGDGSGEVAEMTGREKFNKANQGVGQEIIRASAGRIFDDYCGTPVPPHIGPGPQR